MLILARIKGGAHLYGLNNAESDEDWYDIIAISPAEHQFGVVTLAQGDAVGPGMVDQHEVAIASLVTGRLDTMWALELLFAEPEGECAPEWNRLRDIRRKLCTPALCHQTFYRLQSCVGQYAEMRYLDDEKKTYEWIVKEGFSTKHINARNLAHAYRMATQAMNYIVKRELFATEFMVNRELYNRLKTNVVTVEDVRECLQVMTGLKKMLDDKVGINSEYYESRECFELFWGIVNSTSAAAAANEVPMEHAFTEYTRF